MRFTSTSTIHHPRDAVFAAYRDRLPDVVPYMDDIAAVVVLSRREEASRVHLHNEWASAAEIPAAASSFLSKDDTKWDDHAIWDASNHTCRFEIHTRVFRDAVHCTGTNTFTEVPGGTRVVLEGEFSLDASKVTAIPRLLRGAIVPQVEKFIVSMIQPNLEKTNVAIGRFLDAQG